MFPRLPASLPVTERLLSGCAGGRAAHSLGVTLEQGNCRHSELRGHATRTKTKPGSKRERKGWGNTSF